MVKFRDIRKSKLNKLKDVKIPLKLCKLFYLKVTCRCDEVIDVNFTRKILQDVLLAGIYDADIRG